LVKRAARGATESGTLPRGGNMRKKRYILTPDEWFEMAESAFEAVFGDSQNQQPVAPAPKQPVPKLLPKPVRFPLRGDP